MAARDILEPASAFRGAHDFQSVLPPVEPVRYLC
jgi:hypothetical protein